MLTKKEVMTRLCALASSAGMIVFKEELSHDCFCGNAGYVSNDNFRFEEAVLQFIEVAVCEKIARREDVTCQSQSNT